MDASACATASWTRSYHSRSIAWPSGRGKTRVDGMQNIIAMIIYVVVSAFGLYKIKAAAAVLSLEFALGFALYGAGFLLWMYILLRMPLSIAFPIAAGALTVSTQLLGYFLLGEKLSAVHIAGVVAIMAGITLISIRA